MIRFDYFIKKLADVKVKDYLSSAKFAAAFVLRKTQGKKYKDYWLVCEEPMEARDNGYWFFKFLRNNTDVPCCYAIKKESQDYDKVKVLGETVEYGSLKHWLIYLSCAYNISSQKGGKPNAAFCAFLELNDIIKVKNVFLQHGITINDTRWLYADCSRFTYFFTATHPETEFIKKVFGYSNEVIQYTGFPRFDNLHRFETKKNRILIMPSWRAWFVEKSARVKKDDGNFEDSDYLMNWTALLQSDQLNRMITENNLEIFFFPHRNMQRYLSAFKSINTQVTIASAEKYDVQDLLKTSELLITDYSSVFFDMVYMKKPVLFFQFDEEKFRKQQYQQGYFDYHSTPFGDYCSSVEEVLYHLSRHIDTSYRVSESFLLEHSRVFEKYDDHNSSRIYEILLRGLQ